MSKILVIAEHDGAQLKLATLSAVAFASKVAATTGSSFDVLVIGDNIGAIAEQLRQYGAATVLIADHLLVEHPLADKYADLVVTVARQQSVGTVVAAASTFSKDILPRAAALLDAGMLSDVIDVSPLPGGEAQGEGERHSPFDLIFKRVMFAGNIIATVTLESAIKFVTVRASAFPPPQRGTQSSPVEKVAVDPDKLSAFTEYLGLETKAATRPDSTEARVVVSGGRALKNAEDFERLVGGLADTLGGAIGSSRALVDSGITPNSLQVGQTGKIVAPDLYIAVGISGAIQHLAGMKDTKVIVAINKDPDAPIFEVADYGLVGDVYLVVPELITKLKH
jgi:electron transfer flavoprotein alpha subunit